MKDGKFVSYKLENNGDFVIEGYNFSKPWSSFFPGIAGCFGIPMWLFYVNRGQCVASFGTHSKDEAIMEFFPANKSYQFVPSRGFRTFVKIKKNNRSFCYEPFSVLSELSDPKIKNRMVIRPFDLKIIEKNPSLGLETEVSYFPVVEEPFAALVRETVIRNDSKSRIDIELLDGLSVIMPHGVNNFFLKEMSRTIEAWMSAETFAQGTAVYKLKTDPCDTAHVSFVKGANFYRSFSGSQASGKISMVVDPSLVFGNISDFSFPLEFFTAKQYSPKKKQAANNKTPCAFAFLKKKILPGESVKICSVIGHVPDYEEIKKYGIARLDENFVCRKKEENRELITGITDAVFTSSNFRHFDLYARQTFLDNVLRGGLPYSVSVNGKRKTIYVFSRKHGDLERDYNKFRISPTYFSEGEGNYRDVNQNRRNDIFFNTLIEEENISDFMNLIQLDGYNPLVFKGEMLLVDKDVFLASDFSKLFRQEDVQKVGDFLSKPFSLGGVLFFIRKKKIAIKCAMDEFIRELLSLADSTVESDHGEGFWTDHWTYNNDLLESFRAIYPEKLEWLLFEKKDFTYYDTPIYVKPRSQRYSLYNGEVRQYHCLGIDKEKDHVIRHREHNREIVRSLYGAGAVAHTTLIDKILCLILNKLSTLDPFGVGIEMEAGKPNWCDALNGLPGVIGSSVCETFELKRMILFLKEVFCELKIAPERKISITQEIGEFFNELFHLLKKDPEVFDFWNESNAIKESYRSRVRKGLKSDALNFFLSIGEVVEFLDLALIKINRGISRCFDPKTGYVRSYFINKVKRYEIKNISDNETAILPLEFQQSALPLFLEGFVHAFRTEKDRSAGIFKSLRKSPLWDSKLSMVKVNASLEKETFELGRIKAFTPGWLENESIWLHMEYKFLLELLKSGLTEEFYDSFFKMLIPFQNPNRYGRSILESSSFIVSSAHPDPSLHGRGFVARLSGSTAEFIHMWLFMNIGPRPFTNASDSGLIFTPKPSLKADLFTRKAMSACFKDNLGKMREVKLPANSYSFLFLSKVLITYLNPLRLNTFGKKRAVVKGMRLYEKGNLIFETDSGQLSGHHAELVRSGGLDRIEVLLG